MPFESLDKFTRLGNAGNQTDWKKCLDALFMGLREHFVFDNLALYKSEEASQIVEAVYARATGRGRSQEADVSWGEEIANQVISTRKIISSLPEKQSSKDRTEMPYLLGVPLDLPVGNCALVFIRFAGPEYTTENTAWALLAACQVTRSFERGMLEMAQEQLEGAKRQTQLQGDFIATITHELHTPMGFIKGYTTSLLRSDTNWDASTQKEFLTIIDEETDQLIQLIDRVLDSSRLQSGTMVMDIQPVRLEALLRDVVVRLKGRYPDLAVNLDLQVTPPIQADAVRLGQVFNNLFDNAIKYAPGALIEISLKSSRKNQLVIFSDQGPGIPVEHVPYLFDRFYRAPEGSTKRGTGLGLFICKQIIQAHHGKISVKTIQGKGTSFQINLPVVQPVHTAKR